MWRDVDLVNDMDDDRKDIDLDENERWIVIAKVSTDIAVSNLLQLWIGKKNVGFTRWFMLWTLRCWRTSLSESVQDFEQVGLSSYGRSAGLYKIISWLRPLLLNRAYSCVNQGWYIIKINFLLHFHLRTIWAYSDRRSRGRGFCTALTVCTHPLYEYLSTLVLYVLTLCRSILVHLYCMSSPSVGVS